MRATSKGPSQAPHMRSGDWLLLGMLSLIWGSGFFFAKIAVRDVPPATITLIRAAVASGILLAVMRARGVSLPPRTWPAWRPYWVLGLLNLALPFTLNAWGLVRIESSLAGILTATVPVFTVVVAHYATRDERFSGAKLAGIALGLAGVVAIVGEDPASLTSGSGLAKLAILMSCLAYAISAVYARGLRGVPTLTLTCAQMLTATAMLIPVALVVDRPWQSAAWTRDALLSLAVLSLVNTTIAYLLYFQLLASAGAVNASLVAYLIPVVAVLVGTAFLDERLQPQQLIGMALILASMAVIDGRLARWLASRRALEPADT